jgi:chromate transporter
VVPDVVPEAAPETATAATPTLQQPRSCGQLFWVFTRLAMQGFGGVLAVAQQELVERQRWLSREEFLDMLSVSQVLPGPNVTNLALMIGDRFLGLRGAFAALAGMLVLPLVLMLVLAALYTQYAHHPRLSGALRGMGAVSAGLMLATAYKLARSLPANPLGLPLCLGLGGLTVALVLGLRWPLAAVVLGLGSLVVLLAWHKLRAAPR